jgi:hypothetical protein
MLYILGRHVARCNHRGLHLDRPVLPEKRTLAAAHYQSVPRLHLSEGKGGGGHFLCFLLSFILIQLSFENGNILFHGLLNALLERIALNLLRKKQCREEI